MKLRIVEVKPKSYSYTSYVLQRKFLGFWYDIFSSTLLLDTERKRDQLLARPSTTSKILWSN